MQAEYGKLQLLMSFRWKIVIFDIQFSHHVFLIESLFLKFEDVFSF